MGGSCDAYWTTGLSEQVEYGIKRIEASHDLLQQVSYSQSLYSPIELEVQTVASRAKRPEYAELIVQQLPLTVGKCCDSKDI